MTPLEAIRIYGLEKLGRYYSKYRAVVPDSQPDEDHTGNILVQIPRVQGGMKIIARAKPFSGGSGYGSKYFTPQPGEIVWVEFENGNPTKPLWDYHTWAQGECPDELQGTKTCGLVTPNGNRVVITEGDDKDTLEVKINDTSIKMTGDTITINDGKNKGLVNIDVLRDFIDAVSKDLLVAKSGTNVAQWMASGLPKLEDTKVVH